LRAVQRPRRMREAAMVDDGDEYAQLVEGGMAGISHDGYLVISIKSINMIEI
jgi:hypothetical protein